LTGAAITDLALAEPFIAVGAAVGFWYFFPIEKGLGPRGYERWKMVHPLYKSSKPCKSRWWMNDKIKLILPDQNRFSQS
jgi:hypothetical protein